MSDGNLIQEIREGLLTVTIHRRRVMNSLNRDTIQELIVAFDRAGEDKEVHAVLLTGTGDAFASGADIQELTKLGPLEGRERSLMGQSLMNRIASLPKPVAAAINGYALGGGLELAMACTIRTAVRTAKLGLPEVGLGIIPGFGGTQRLPRLVGLGRALELILTGDRIDAEEAYRIGLVNRIFNRDELLEGTEKILRTMMSRGPVAVRYALEAATKGVDLALADGLDLEATLFGVLASTEDKHEGLSAFLERRKPKFKGR
jgi:enoyl-CoA hydratase